jgi:hypothetical protein
MSVNFEGRPFPETLVLADAEVMYAPSGGADDGTMWLHPDGIIGIVPLPGGVWHTLPNCTPMIRWRGSVMAQPLPCMAIHPSRVQCSVVSGR